MDKTDHTIEISESTQGFRELSVSKVELPKPRVLKRNGSYQELDIDKIHAVLEWACNGDENIPAIKGVSVAEIELNAKLQFHDKIRTSDIHNILISSAAALISEDNPNYDHVAGRLVWFKVRKEAFSNNSPPHLSLVIAKNVKTGFYDPQIYELYNEDEIDVLNRMIDHSRDDLFRYAGAEQMRLKYLCQNRKTRKPTESFQFPYIMVAATLFSSYPKEQRMTFVKDYYDEISTHGLNEPTPVMSGVRTLVRQYSSCVVVSAGDSLDSIDRAGTAILRYASRKAGIGIDGGRIRGIGQSIRGGEAISTGQIPFIKKFNADLKSSAQGGVRGASATYNFQFWHQEWESLIELKNEKGTDETRVRTLDYAPHFNFLFFERWAKRQNITLFSPEDVPGLWEAFYSSDTNKFRTLYEKYENISSISKRQIPALEVAHKFLLERFESGRIYPMFADTVNTQTPFLEPITSTNLCAEITLPTRPLSSEDHTIGRIALCTLGALNLGKIGDLVDPKEHEALVLRCRLAVRAKDALLTYQDYPMEEARLAVEDYRPLGIGVIGLAHWMAKNGLRWGEADMISKYNELIEFISYHLIEASVELAEELGPCKKRTKYTDGWMPWHDSKIVLPKKLDWDSLSKRAISAGGTRNATLMAGMPSETSSQLANETNGVEPPKSLITRKDSKDGTLPQVVPEYSKLSNRYETVWEVSSEKYLRTIAVQQHYYDQAISANTSYDPLKMPRDPESGKVLLSTFASDFILAYNLGFKTLYYSNVRRPEGLVDESEDNGCESGACKI
jgi:ribonucleoside-diphosphate reductase alpha chain